MFTWLFRWARRIAGEIGISKENFPFNPIVSLITWLDFDNVQLPPSISSNTPRTPVDCSDHPSVKKSTLRHYLDKHPDIFGMEELSDAPDETMAGPSMIHPPGVPYNMLLGNAGNEESR
jgi:hypothetical protein